MTATANTAEPSPVRAYRTLVGMGMLAGLLVAFVFQATAPRIAANRATKLAHAIALLLPSAHTWRGYAVNDAGSLLPATASRATVWAVFDAQSELLGFAIRGDAMGYQDRIQALYGYDPFSQRIVGLEILASLETPGLGSRIATDQAFRANFGALDVELDPAGQRLDHPLVVVPNGTREQPWEIDAITGATVSSRAIGTLLNDSAARMLPIIQANLSRLSDG